jgi:hypothetical protein
VPNTNFHAFWAHHLTPPAIFQGGVAIEFSVLKAWEVLPLKPRNIAVLERFLEPV